MSSSSSSSPVIFSHILSTCITVSATIATSFLIFQASMNFSHSECPQGTEMNVKQAQNIGGEEEFLRPELPAPSPLNFRRPRRPPPYVPSDAVWGCCVSAASSSSWENSIPLTLARYAMLTVGVNNLICDKKAPHQRRWELNFWTCMLLLWYKLWWADQRASLSSCEEKPNHSFAAEIRAASLTARGAWCRVPTWCR